MFADSKDLRARLFASGLLDPHIFVMRLLPFLRLLSLHKVTLSLPSAALALLFVSGSGCDSEPASDALLSVQGSFELGADPTGLTPAVAFLTREPALHIADVHAQGDFPGHVRIDLYDPPPEDVFLDFRGVDGSTTKLALGLLTAVALDHPDYAPVITRHMSLIVSMGGGCAPEGCSFWEQFCIGLGSDEECYQKLLNCPAPDSPAADCAEVESEGDSDIPKQPWVSIQGLSENYYILYLKQPAEAGSQVAIAFGARQGLGAGYHLIAARRLPESEQANIEGCKLRAERLALDRYNGKHGVSLELQELERLNCKERESGGLHCNYSESREFWTLYADAAFELECPTGTKDLSPASNPIAVQLGRSALQDLPPGL